MRSQASMNLLVVGGGYSGMIAASRAARARNVKVTLIDAKPSFVQRIRLHEALAGGDPATLDYQPLLAQRGITFVQGFVQELDLASGRVRGRTAAGQPLDLGYDTVVLALGSTTSAPIPGVAEHAVRLNDLQEVRSASQQVHALAERRGRILIVGGGMTGIEMASELAERFPTLRVTLATGGAFGRDYTPAARAYLRTMFQRMGIDLREYTSITALEAGVAHLAEGDTLAFDMCVWSGGFVATPLARAAGLPTDTNGRVPVDATLRVPGHAEIFVAGDAAALPFGAGTLRMGCVAALPLGGHVGDNIAHMARGEALRPFNMGFVIRCISLGRRNGLIQTTERDDTPRPRIFTQKTAAWTKEAICRMTFETVRWETRSGLRLYAWPAGPVQRSLAPIALDA